MKTSPATNTTSTTSTAPQPPARPTPDDIRRQLGWGLVQTPGR